MFRAFGKISNLIGEIRERTKLHWQFNPILRITQKSIKVQYNVENENCISMRNWQ